MEKNFKEAMKINADLARVRVEQEKLRSYAQSLERASTYDLREVVNTKVKVMMLDREIAQLEKERDGYLAKCE